MAPLRPAAAGLLVALLATASGSEEPVTQCSAEEASQPGRALLQLAGNRQLRVLEAHDPNQGDEETSKLALSAAMAQKEECQEGKQIPDQEWKPPPAPEATGASPVFNASKRPALLQDCQPGYMLVAGACTLRPLGEPDVWLKATNIYRCMHGAPLVSWSAPAAASAQDWANSLTDLVHSDCYHIPPPAGPAGENLAMGQLSQESAVADWYSEVSCCASFPGCPATSSSCVVGHFTAMVWAGVSQIGCATNSARQIYVCRYRSGDTLSSLTANMGGAYASNVFQRVKDAAQCIAEVEAAMGSNTTPTAAPPSTTATTTRATTTTTRATSTTTRATTTAAPSSRPLTVTSGPCTLDSSGCVLSPNFPNQYGNSQTCSIAVAGTVAVSTTSFSTESGWDKLTVNGIVYSGSSGISNVLATGTISWLSDCSVTSTGWRLCPAGAVPSTTTSTTTAGSASATSPLQVTSGPCTRDAQGCVVSPNFPNQYGNNQACNIAVTGSVYVSATSFSTEAGWDKLRISGLDYSGASGPQNVAAAGTITWTADSSVTSSGWRVCPGGAAPPPTTPTTTTSTSAGPTTTTTRSGPPLPACTAPAAGSRGSCESCLVSAHCQSGLFCCPFMKKCVASSSTGCYPPIGNCGGCGSSCWDSGCGSSCQCANVGPGKRWNWLEYVNLANSATGNPQLTCWQT